MFFTEKLVEATLLFRSLFPIRAFQSSSTGWGFGWLLTWEVLLFLGHQGGALKLTAASGSALEACWACRFGFVGYQQNVIGTFFWMRLSFL